MNLLRSMLAALLLTGLSHAPGWAQYQALTPDCCLQAKTLQSQIADLQSRFSQQSLILSRTRQTGQQLLEEKDQRLSQLETQGNSRLTAAGQRETRLTETLATVTRALETELQTPRILGLGRKAALKRIKALSAAPH